MTRVCHRAVDLQTYWQLAAADAGPMDCRTGQSVPVFPSTILRVGGALSGMESEAAGLSQVRAMHRSKARARPEP